MRKITTEVRWTEKNYECGWGEPGVGAVVCAARDFDELKKEFAESLRFHIEGNIELGMDVPEWLAREDYEIEYRLHTSALLRQAEQYTTLSAISAATGINVKQLSHYANSTKNPRPQQRARIIEGLRAIGTKLLSYC